MPEYPWEKAASGGDRFRPPAERVKAGPISWIVRTLLVIGGVALINENIEGWDERPQHRGATATIVFAKDVRPGVIDATVELRHRDSTLEYRQYKPDRFVKGDSQNFTLPPNHKLIKEQRRKDKAKLIGGIAGGTYLILAALAFSKHFDRKIVGWLGMGAALTCAIGLAIATTSVLTTSDRGDLSDAVFVGLALAAGTTVMIRTWMGGYVGGPYSLSVEEQRITMPNPSYTLEKVSRNGDPPGWTATVDRSTVPNYDKETGDYVDIYEVRSIPQSGTFATRELAIAAARGLASGHDPSTWNLTDWHVGFVDVHGINNRGKDKVAQSVMVVAIEDLEEEPAEEYE